jgi:dolichol-phosphate mannosyltransferase
VSDSIVIIPTYNEKENIEKIIRFVFSLKKDFDILIVEDNSPDGTAEIVRRMIAEFPGRLFMEERKGKLGLGTVAHRHDCTGADPSLGHRFSQRQ